MIRIAQLSDTHFLEAGVEAEGGFGYDTAAAFDAVADHLTAAALPDLIVVTGDVADHGRAEQYERAADAFARLPVAVNVCPGNHDQDATFRASMERPSISLTRRIERDNWCMLFVDSNAGVMSVDADGERHDPDDYQERLHGNGALDAHERDWIRHAHDETDAAHVFVWLHHPPAPDEALSFDQGYADEWRTLLAHLPKVRALAGGHTHVPRDYIFEGLPVYVCPALKHNFDLVEGTMLPPGYRSFELAQDGSVSSTVELVDDPRWPRRPLSRSVLALLNGELSFAEFMAIVERKRAEA